MGRRQRRGYSRGGADAANLDYQAGLAAAQAKDWTVAVVARMTAVTQQDPKNANAWNELGHAYRLLGDMDNSFKNYARALDGCSAPQARHEYWARPTFRSSKLDMARRNRRR